MNLTQEEINANLQKIKQKMGNSSQIGGKGTQRRHAKHLQKTNVFYINQAQQDKRCKQIITKFQAQPLSAIDQVFMVKDDQTVLHFDKPESNTILEVFTSPPNNIFIIQGTPQTKKIRDMIPQIIPYLGLKHAGYLKKLCQQEGRLQKQQNQVPQLIQNFQEVSKTD